MLYNSLQMAGGHNRLVGTKKGVNSPLLALRLSMKHARILRRLAKGHPSKMARELLEKALEKEEKRR